MRKAWLTAFTAAFCAAGFVATLAPANPASMAMSKRRPATPESKSSIWPWSKTAAPAPAPPPVVGRPTEPISATRHPIQYLKATAARMPIGSKGKSASAPRVAMQPAPTKPDAISLSTPTGPPSPEFFIFAAQVCERQGDVPQARSNLQRALTMWPGHVEVLRAAARMEDRQGNLPLAENLYGQAVAANPQHAGALNDLGLCLARQGKLEPSLQTLEQAVQLQPAKALYRNNAATVLVELHQDQRRSRTWPPSTARPTPTITWGSCSSLAAVRPKRPPTSRPLCSRIQACKPRRMRWRYFRELRWLFPCRRELRCRQFQTRKFSPDQGSNRSKAGRPPRR